MPDFGPSSFRRTRLPPESLPAGAVLVDRTRERTSWAEGMFVTATHFNRDQSYIVTRQSDLGRAIGAGVVEGLEVTLDPADPTAIRVAPGLGIGGGGESIVLHAPLRIGLADMPLQKQLSRQAGLLDSLQLLSETRSGLFALCAVPVEYTSNPIGSYATASDGRRRLMDSVVNEATLFTLVPFSLASGSEGPEARQAMAARRIFADGAMPALPPSALPLAVLELDGNVPVWLDMHLARREAGGARADVFGLGIVDTAQRIAHFRQYDAALDRMVTAAPGLGFAASSRFAVLPPMGRMPAACVAPREPAPGVAAVLSHNWLPAEMPVELVALPEDEVDQLLEESLTLPPIDLSAPAAALAETPVTIIVPVARADWAGVPLELVQSARTLQPAAPLNARPRTPMELITALLEQDRDPDLVDPMVDAPWLALLAGRATLWYARRRQVLRTDALAGEAVPYVPAPAAPAPDLPEVGREVEGATTDQLTPLGLGPLVARVQATNDADGLAARAMFDRQLARVLAAGSALAATDLLHRAVQAAVLDRPTVEALAALYADADLRDGLGRLEGLVTGGAVDLAVPAFGAEAEISAELARDAALGADPVAADGPALPDEMEERVKRLIEQLGLPRRQSANIAASGGVLPLGDPRNGERRAEALKAAEEQGVPLIARARNPGGIEMQTRRNLIALSGLVPKLAERLARPVSPDRFAEHAKAMDEALTLAPDAARAAVAEAVTKLMEA